MPAKDIAIKDVEWTAPDTPVADIAATMAERDIGSVVVTEDHRPVGIVTDRDLAVRVLAGEGDPDGLVAEEVMSPEPATVQSTAGVLEIATEMCERRVCRMPVVDDHGTIVGIVTLDDLLGLFVDELADLADVVAIETPSG